MLNRLMFIYFLQRKDFLDGATAITSGKLEAIERSRAGHVLLGFLTRYFLLKAFHEGLRQERSAELRRNCSGRSRISTAASSRPHRVEDG